MNSSVENEPVIHRLRMIALADMLSWPDNSVFSSFVPSPDDRVPITPARFISGVLPVYLCYYIMALLVILPGTRYYRLALLPIGLYLAFRAGTTYDVSCGDPAQKYRNYGQCVCRN